MKENPWLQIILAAVTAYYFGYLYGRKEVTSGMQPGQIIIEGESYLVPQNVYDTVAQLVGYKKKEIVL